MYRSRTFVLWALVSLALSVGAWGQSDFIPVQGRVTNAAGVPLDGTYILIFRLYDVAIGGSPLCVDPAIVEVDHGVFTTYFNAAGCEIDGRELFLGVEVEYDGEMTPRLYVDNAIYAWGLRPEATILGASGEALLQIENSAIEGRGLRAVASATSGTNFGVIGASSSPSGYGGYFHNDADGVGLRSVASGDSGGDAIEGQSESGDGVKGETEGSSGRGVYADNTGSGIAIAARSSSVGNFFPTLYLVQENATGNFVIGAGTYWGTRYFRIDRSGKGYFEGGTQTGGADFAERLDVARGAGEPSPGDVLVVSSSTDRAVELSSQPYSTSVIGVYSTRPGVLAGASDLDGPMPGVPVAITGVVPCRVTREGGAIRRGDLLVSSSTPGHAMRADVAPPPGTLLGKALQPMDDERGLIEILVNAQ